MELAAGMHILYVSANSEGADRAAHELRPFLLEGTCKWNSSEYKFCFCEFTPQRLQN